MNTKLIRSNDVVWEELDGTALLIHSSTGQRWSLNAAAASIWKLCDGRRSIGDIARLLGQCCKWPARRAQKEVAAFCEALAECGILTPALLSAPVTASGTISMRSGLNAGPSFKTLGLGSNPRRRPSPRGISGPG